MNQQQPQSTKKVLNRQVVLNLFIGFFFVFSTGLFLVRAFTAFPLSKTSRLFDFGWYEYAFKVVWNHQPPSFLYSRQHELHWIHNYLQGTPWHLNGGSQYLYPPQFAVLFSWIAALPVHIANLVWDSILTLSFLGAVVLLLRMIQQQHGNRRSSGLLIVLLLSISLFWRPFRSDIYWGNSDSLVFFLVILTFYLQNYSKRSALAGIPLGLAVLFKVTPVILMFVFVIKHPRTSVSALLTILFGTSLTAIVLGWKPIIYYTFHFGAMAHRSAVLNGNGGTAPWNSSIKGVLQLLRHGGLPWITPAVINATFAVFVIAVLSLMSIKLLSRHGYTDQVERQIGMLVLSLVLFSPVIENHYIILALAPYLFTVSRTVKTWDTLPSIRKSFAVAGMVAALVLINPVGAAMTRWYTNVLPIHYFLGITLIALFQFFPINRAKI
ncbi:glycosyltransferase family 87 protein [Alicyclobacillus sp. SO9]|uniref:glycosyltransferase family 87 protein n=1 Tax=Alicyclobacillus sp. SO9 TaxID=2665646 RepID=UPI0018E8847D|nr:glycosyltransferase family 87 protein [Alicyclobacillus sp. SO9]QQE79044.1 DUF2029 domain-containing protein [Alicyclobacillus sp. SO9]